MVKPTLCLSVEDDAEPRARRIRKRNEGVQFAEGCSAPKQSNISKGGNSRPNSSPSAFYRELGPFGDDHDDNDTSDLAVIEALLRVPLSRWDDLLYAEA